MVTPTPNAPLDPALSARLELPRGEVHVYLSSPDELFESARLARFEAWLAPSERARRDRYMFERNRREYLLTRALVRSTLSLYAPVRPEAWSFRPNPWGRPEIATAGFEELRFNLSNTRGLLACAVARDREIGVDVEEIERASATVGVAERFFSPLEVRDLKALPESKQRARFFDYWTLKEAYIKARGMGLAIPLDKFSFHLDEGQPIRVTTHPELADDASTWQFEVLRVGPRHKAALAIRRGDDPPLRVVMREPDLP